MTERSADIDHTAQTVDVNVIGIGNRTNANYIELAISVALVVIHKQLVDYFGSQPATGDHNRLGRKQRRATAAEFDSDGIPSDTRLEAEV